MGLDDPTPAFARHLSGDRRHTNPWLIISKNSLMVKLTITMLRCGVLMKY